MDPTVVIAIVVAMLLVLLAAGVHIGVALGASGMVGMIVLIGWQGAMANLRGLPYNTTAVYSLAIVPMFILMGAFFSNAGFTRDSFQAAAAWLGRIKGGLAAATVVACAVFGAVTGSSVANAAVFSRIALPEMVRQGVDKRLAAGCVAASGTLASLIPPSLLLVVFAIITEQSVRMLLLAGIIPGILSVFVYLGGIFVRVVLNPDLVDQEKISAHLSLRHRLLALRPLWGAAVVFGTVMGGIYFGWFTPTQAGAIGAAAAFLLGFVPGRSVGVSGIWTALRETGATTGAILLILVGGTFMSRFLGHSGAVRALSEFMLGLEMPAFFYFLIYGVLILVLGMFLEAFAIMVLVLPLMYPILVDVGFHPIWIGILTIKLVEIGLITPPVGLNVYVVRSASPVPMSLNDVFAGITPFLLLDAVTIALLIAFPGIVLLMPSLVA
jgi:C4-dicarboxylate transporter, DctM subunit